MSDFTAVAGKVAGIISLAAFVPYIISILRGKKPNRATWLIWTVSGLMLVASYHASGANHTIWVPVAYVVCPFITFIISIKYGEGGLTKFDISCLFIAGISSILWWIFHSPLIALIINLIIDFAGALPTIKKAYFKSKSEDSFAWSLSFIANIVNMFAIEKWTFAITLYPVYMLLVTGIIAILTFQHKKD